MDLGDMVDTSLSSHGYMYPRASGLGSTHGGGGTSSASSTQNSDDDEESDSSHVTDCKDRRRAAHTVAEQKRRDAIKKGYEQLMATVPTCQQLDWSGNQKMSKAAVLKKSIDFLHYLSQQKKKQEKELESLRKDVMALKIMKARRYGVASNVPDKPIFVYSHCTGNVTKNYEHIVRSHQNSPADSQDQVPVETKFQVFQRITDTLFASFDRSIYVANFAQLSASVFSWLEEHCNPQERFANLQRYPHVTLVTEAIDSVTKG